jgi:hypothetical protein
MTVRFGRVATTALILGGVSAVGLVGEAAPAYAKTTVLSFTTPGIHNWTVPAGVTHAAFDVFGAQGGQGNRGGSPAGIGGLGGEATVTAAVVPGTEYQINVGGQGLSGALNPGAAGGSNGGGQGGQYGGGGGGGASDVRTGGYQLADRVVIAGGGGGGGAGPAAGPYNNGGAGGGVTGGAGADQEKGGGGGTDSAGGFTPVLASGTAGDAGVGGRGGNGGLSGTGSYYGGGGGGGGYFGGGGGAWAYQGSQSAGGGGGGSGYGPAGTAFKTGAPAGDGKVVISFTRPQPDLMVKRSSDPSYIGKDVYNSTGTGEVRGWKVAVGHTRTFDVRLQNDGAHADDFNVSGAGSTRKFRVTYRRGTTDVTTQMVGAGLHVHALAASANVTYTVAVTATKRAAAGDIRAVKVTATSAADASRVDAVKAQVTVG